jgi:hypothetical protein
MPDETIRDILVRLALDPVFRAALQQDSAVALAPYHLPPEDEAAFRAGDERMLGLLGRAQRAGGIRPTSRPPVATPTEQSAPEPTIPPPPVLPELRFLVRCAPYPYWNGESWQVSWGVFVHPAPAEPEIPEPTPSIAPIDRRAALRDAVLAADPAHRWEHIAALAAEIGRV